jgi:hypothetical protein
MTKIVVDPATLSQLRAAHEVVALCDDAGHVVGHFHPVASPDKPKRLEPQISEEEIRRRLRQGGGRSLTEIKADLEKRA